MKKLKYYPAFLLIMLILFSCKDDAVQSGNLDLFFTSFESYLDVSDWAADQQITLSGEPSPGGGLNSLVIGGGCVQPAASLNIGTVQRDGFLRVSFQSRMLQENQSAVIYLIDYQSGGVVDSAGVNVSSTSWKEYTSGSPVRASAGDSLRIDVYAGGIILAEVMLDQLRIYYVQ